MQMQQQPQAHVEYEHVAGKSRSFSESAPQTELSSTKKMRKSHIGRPRPTRRP